MSFFLGFGVFRYWEKLLLARVLDSMCSDLVHHGPLWSAKAKACLGKHHSLKMPIARETPLFEVWEVRGLGHRVWFRRLAGLGAERV